MSDGSKWPENLEQAAALLRKLPVADAPDWLLALAARPEYRYKPDDSAWVSAAEQFASSQPDLLLTFLTALRPIPVDRKQRTLDAVGAVLAIGLVAQPTLAACRAAISEADEAPRRRSIYCRDRAPADIDAVLSALVLDALGCADASRSAACTVVVKREESFVPGDVNQPERHHQWVTVSGTRGRETKLTVGASVGEYEMWFDVEAVPDERDRILAKLWRTFGRPALV